MSIASKSLGRNLGNGLALQSLTVLTVVCMAVFGWAYFGYSAQRSEQIDRQKAQLEHLFAEARDGAGDQALRHKLDDMLVGNSQLSVKIFRADDTLFFQAGVAEKTSQQVFTFELSSPDQRDENWHLVLGLDTAAETRSLRKLAFSLAAAAAIGSLLISAGGYLLVRRGLRPVHRLIEQTQALTIETRDQRLDASAQPAELVPLVLQFNELLERLQMAYDRLEAFNADVAHELATPLTTLIGGTELVLRKRRSPNETRQMLECNLEELQRLTRIVQDMLFLARADHGAEARRTPQQDLGALLRRVSEFHEAELAEKGLTIQVEGDAHASVDTSLIERAISNLLSNAIRYALPESTICMTTGKRDRRLYVEVKNRGGMLPPAHLERIFDRFYRADPSRSDAHRHHGLGLSIVAAIARMHGGRTFAFSMSGYTTIGFTLNPSNPEVVCPSLGASISLSKL